MRIRVEVKNEILGDSVFWEGPADRVDDIRNVPARVTAKMVVKDGQARVSGMWHVCALSDAGEPLAQPAAQPPAERSPAEKSPALKLVEFLNANASGIRPPSKGAGQG